MSKVIDLRLDFPPAVEEIVGTLKFFVLNKDGRGVANYRQIFGPRMADNLGVSFEELEKMSDDLSPEEFDAFLQERAEKIAVSLPEFEKSGHPSPFSGEAKNQRGLADALNRALSRIWYHLLWLRSYHINDRRNHCSIAR